MGDRRRHRVFADFVSERYPRARRILAVADGKGQLAIALAEHGYEVRIVEPNLRKFAHRFFHGRRHRRITFTRGLFQAEQWDGAEDLIVGMHPDEATSEIVLAAQRLQKPFAVVPCCLLGRHSAEANGDFFEWLRLLKRLARQHVDQVQLAFEGRNTVLYT